MINEDLLREVLRVRSNITEPMVYKKPNILQSTAMPDENLTLKEWFIYIRTRKKDLDISI